MVLIGYKKCQPIKDNITRVIGIFEFLDDSKLAPININNEFALYRTNKCKLIGVEDLSGNLLNLTELEPVRFINNDSNVIFKLNEITKVTSFDNSTNIIGDGILIFLNIMRAKFYLLEYLNNGLLIKWRDNGIVYSEVNFSNNKKHGISKYYHNNGNIKKVCEYKNNNLINIETIYDINGTVFKIIDHTIKFEESIYKT